MICDSLDISHSASTSPLIDHWTNKPTKGKRPRKDRPIVRITQQMSAKPLSINIALPLTKSPYANIQSHQAEP
ncbi:hypothetical protein L1987_61506 [Smallanthus sonchifolius]|uniref:Uncharacterized protein n=1 Tax=Smallanthus sonchifolius TaxID=185202 RepID=A0ACB9C7R6_9ASTR|nr:hypothetical protein L1987_61506 [Smallanthus sonchifolius]